MPIPRSSEERDFYQASDESKRAAERFDARQFEVIREAARYYERIALLNGGALVLSVTFLGYLSSRQVPRIAWIIVLHFAWGFLLLGLLAAIFRNRIHSGYTYYSAFCQMADRVIGLNTAEIQLLESGNVQFVDAQLRAASTNEIAKDLEKKRETWNRSRENAERKRKISERVFRVLEFGAEGCLVVGLILLIFFAVRNAP
jgi:uncharacterized protein (DUF486 family)